MEGRIESLTNVLVEIYVLLPMGGRKNHVTHECRGENLGPSTYRWKDEPSHSRVSLSKFKSFYLRVEGRTKSLTSVLVEIYVLLPMCGRTNPVTHEYLGQNLSPSIYGWKDEPSHSRVSWSKFKSFYLWVEGRTQSLMSVLVKI